MLSTIRSLCVNVELDCEWKNLKCTDLFAKQIVSWKHVSSLIKRIFRVYAFKPIHSINCTVAVTSRFTVRCSLLSVLCMSPLQIMTWQHWMSWKVILCELDYNLAHKGHREILFEWCEVLGFCLYVSQKVLMCLITCYLWALHVH